MLGSTDAHRARLGFGTERVWRNVTLAADMSQQVVDMRHNIGPMTS